VNTPRAESSTEALSGRPTLRLLSLGLGGPSRHVAMLLLRLAAPDGGAWLTGALAKIPLDGADPAAFFLGRDTSLLRLRSAKDSCKRLSTGDEDTKLAGTLGYLLAVGAALDLHDEIISSRPPSELADVLLDLAQVMSGQWEPMLARAALRAYPFSGG
jgi:hypothetical protein